MDQRETLRLSVNQGELQLLPCLLELLLDSRGCVREPEGTAHGPGHTRVVVKLREDAVERC